MTLSNRLRQSGDQGAFTSDTGWGCMIRSGQSLLANVMMMLDLGQDWRRGQNPDHEQKVLSLFADDPSAPFSIHRFVEHGASACGKHPGEWFGPSATARCIRELVEKHPTSNLRVYVRPDDSDIYETGLLSTSHTPQSASFQPTLILVGTRLGIDRINPVYNNALSRALSSRFAAGIAGGRPSSSHYFFGVQGTTEFFYLDPHFTRPALPTSPTKSDIDSCHTTHVRKLHVDEMDPSMLIGFLIRNETEWHEWKAEVQDLDAVKGTDGRGKQIVHVYETDDPAVTTAMGSDGIRTDAGIKGMEGVQRESAVDDVMSCDELEDL